MPEYWLCAKQVMTRPWADGYHQLMDVGGGATLLMHKAKVLEGKYPKRSVQSSAGHGARRRVCVRRGLSQFVAVGGMVIAICWAWGPLVRLCEAGPLAVRSLWRDGRHFAQREHLAGG